MTSQPREALKVLNGQSKLKQPTKLTSKDDSLLTESMISDSKENTENGLKRKKTEADLRESLKQRKLNSTMTLEPTTRRTALNQTIDLGSSSTVRRAVTSVTSTVRPAVKKTTSSTTLNKTTIVKSTAKTAPPSELEALLPPGFFKKVPESDLKGRLAENEKLTRFLCGQIIQKKEEAQELSKKVSEKESQIDNIKQVKSTLEDDVQCSKKELQEVYQEKLNLQNQMVMMQQEHNLRLQSQISKYQALESQHASTVSQLNMSRAECENLRMTVESQTGQIASINVELGALKANLQASQSLCADKQRKIEELLITIDRKNNQITELEAQIREDEVVRKKLHNTIQELKGNIRVFCRVRPYIGAELSEFGNELPHFEFNPHNDRTIDIIPASGTTATGKAEGAKKFNFVFDKVFGTKSSQEQVFQEISQLVQSALDGYNTCIFAYGQTGSGKTYTMEGPGIQEELDMPIVDEEKRGMIPRAVEQIFKSAESQKDKGWEYEMDASFLEIYNETINDLLATKAVKPDTKYEIKHDSKGNTSVTNLTVYKVRSPHQVYELLHRASTNRAVSRTDMNERSSRSHSVFQLKLTGENKITGEKVCGLLNLIDLAGSERLDKSGATGNSLKETQHINKSLAHLGDVIAALANKDPYIPYRNSKLTYLLQNSLGGNSKTLMFVNVSPRMSDLNETISSLRFATKVNACEIGTAKKQVKVEMK